MAVRHNFKFTKADHPIPYLDMCERLWRGWMRDELSFSNAISSRFELDAAPEPYLAFSPGYQPLTIVTTNPGRTMPHQRREAILSGGSELKATMNYAEAAVELANYYKAELAGAAKRRVEAQIDIAMRAGYTGVFQVECCPWHSAKLPDKSAFVKLMRSDRQLTKYVTALRDFLIGRPALALCAASTKQPLESDMQFSNWLQFQVDLLGIRRDHADWIPLVCNEGGTTAAALVDQQQVYPKVLILMQGGNHFPAYEARKRLAAEIHRGKNSKIIHEARL